MKNYPWIFLSAGLLSALAFAQGACGSSTSNGGGGSTSTGTTTTTKTGTTTSSGTGGSTMLACTDVVDTTAACGGCLADKCCDPVANCANDSDCFDCATGAGDPTACASNTLYTAYTTCQTGSCDAECTPHSECNPVTSAECTTAGDGCDLGGDQTYKCFGDATVAVCGDCDQQNGPYCAPGATCLYDDTGKGKCARFCCANSDCGATGTCDMSAYPGGVGVCIATGTGADGGVASPACDAPTTSPSGGSCFTL